MARPGSQTPDIMRRMFEAAIRAGQPANCMGPHIPEPPRGRLIVIGAGKAAAVMAQAFENLYPGPVSGLVVTRYGYAVPTRQIEVIEAAHPVPDAAGIQAAQRIREHIRGLTADDLVVALISGGGSALLVAPLEGITLADQQALNQTLLQSGASIGEMNCVRRHLSAVKGGKLAAECFPAKVITLLISDVPGDHPWDISSGPTVADPTTCDDALAILHRRRIEVAPHILQALTSGRGETLKPRDPRLAGHRTIQIAGPQQGLEAAAEIARAAGIIPYILGTAIEGESREVAKVMAGIALQVASHGHPFPMPCVLLSGGETTVTVRGNGRGGRNVEFLLALAIALHGHPRIHAIAGDTDGVDGQEEIAGAYIAPDTLARARTLGIVPEDSLTANDSHTFFKSLDDSIVTGPTYTNLNDFRAILIR